MNALLDLVAFCPPPRRDPDHQRPGDTTGTFTAPTPAPAEHLRLTATYGAGSFDDFLLLFTWHCDNPYLDIERNTRTSATFMANKRIPELRKHLAGLGTTPEGLVRWGATDNADSLYWIPTGPPDEWPSIIVEAGQLSFLTIHQPSTAVILHLLDGSLRCPFFPPDFPSDSPQFTPM